MQAHGAPVLKDLVLLGGGHAHVEVLRSFGMKPMPGVRLTLVTKDIHTPYSGMLPGYVAGWYTFDDVHVDLSKLCTFAGARLINAEASNIDTQAQRVQLAGRPAVAYDVLTIDIGITPSAEVPGAREVATPVKPISRFVDRLQRVLDHAQDSKHSLTVAVVGGGAGGSELSLGLNARLKAVRQAAGHAEDAECIVKLFSRGKILPGHTPAARRKLLRIAKEQGVEVLEEAGIAAVQPGMLVMEDGTTQPFDECLWCTQACAAPWLQQTGLQLDEQGFILVNDCLQAAAGPANVFACGDVATCKVHPRPKAGVFAVRAGPPLVDNLRRHMLGRPLLPFIPQTSWLSLITTGTKHVIGTKGWLCLEGDYLWSLKDWIDKSWMRKYGEDLPAMEDMAARGMQQQQQPAPGPTVASAAGPEAVAALSAAKMRCGGCGGKVGASILSRGLARLPSQLAGVDDVIMGLDSPDDAAVTRPPPPGHLLVDTVDFFRSFVSDPYVFGAIAATHSLGDCHAMGAQPQTALAIAAVPFGLEAKVEEDLFQMMAGAVQALERDGCRLVGGHTCEAEELSLGFSVRGSAEKSRLMVKGGLRAGQVLVLTKPIGTGTIMKAGMEGKAKGRWVAGALVAMQQSSSRAAHILQQAGATGCTDVTGFGLLGHLVEMLRPSQVSAELELSAVPLLDGALECCEAGLHSSIHEQNARASVAVSNAEQAVQQLQWPLLLDPQTGGGLLAGIPAEQSEACLQQLFKAGYEEASIIGKVLPAGAGSSVHILLD